MGASASGAGFGLAVKWLGSFTTEVSVSDQLGGVGRCFSLCSAQVSTVSSEHLNELCFGDVGQRHEHLPTTGHLLDFSWSVSLGHVAVKRGRFLDKLVRK